VIREGTKVKWQWGQGWGHGSVVEVHREKVERELKGTKVTRVGSDKDPAYLIKQSDGDLVLKLKSEIERDD